MQIDYKATFIPMSRSQRAERGINWRVTINGFTTTYWQGIGHLPQDFQEYLRSVGMRGGRISLDADQALSTMLETGRYQRFRVVPPKIDDVLSCLVWDAYAGLDHPTFESFAREFGYDLDSFSARKVYKECIQTGLHMRAIFGEQGLRELRDKYQDY